MLSLPQISKKFGLKKFKGERGGIAEHQEFQIRIFQKRKNEVFFFPYSIKIQKTMNFPNYPWIITWM